MTGVQTCALPIFVLAARERNDRILYVRPFLTTAAGVGEMQTNLDYVASISPELADRVEFAGWVDPPWSARRTFDVLAVPSFTEGFPLVIVEAMLAGIPVVASAVGGIPEIVVDGDTGLLVPPHDAPALADALRRLLGDPDLRQAMAARCRQVALAQYTAATMAAHFETLYRELRDRRGRGR